MRHASRLRHIGVAALLLTALAFTACEKDKSVSGAGPYFQSNPYSSDPRATPTAIDLSISPSSAVITNLGAKAVFTAVGGTGPYRWNVANGNGHVSPVGADQAIYSADAIGPNQVIVIDDNGQAAAATIDGSTPTPAALTATATPASLGADGSKSILTASGGTAPYTWTVIDASLGHIVGSSAGASAVYMRDHSGDNVVTVTDASGSSVNILITQP